MSPAEYLNLLQGYDKAILMLNTVEYKRIFANDSSTSVTTEGGVGGASASFASAVIVVKREHDEISLE
jgi:hypothetical protein